MRSKKIKLIILIIIYLGEMKLFTNKHTQTHTYIYAENNIQFLNIYKIINKYKDI